MRAWPAIETPTERCGSRLQTVAPFTIASRSPWLRWRASRPPSNPRPRWCDRGSGWRDAAIDLAADAGILVEQHGRKAGARRRSTRRQGRPVHRRSRRGRRRMRGRRHSWPPPQAPLSSRAHRRRRPPSGYSARDLSARRRIPRCARDNNFAARCDRALSSRPCRPERSEAFVMAIFAATMRSLAALGMTAFGQHGVIVPPRACRFAFRSSCPRAPAPGSPVGCRRRRS